MNCRCACRASNVGLHPSRYDRHSFLPHLEVLQSNVYRSSHKGLQGLLSFFPSKPFILQCGFFAKPVREKYLVSFHVLGRFGAHGCFTFMRVMLFRYFHIRWNGPIRNLKSYAENMMSIR